jgi:hypothetical protein
MAAPAGGCGREFRRPSGHWYGRRGAGGRRRRRASAAGSARAHAREMDRKCDRRSRCRVCRKHFHADPRAPTQKVCSAPCRLVWRHKHAKQRRALDLEGHREADRARQQAWREARRAATGAPATSSRRVTPPRRGGFVTRRLPRATHRKEGGNLARVGQGVTAVTRQLGAGSGEDPRRKCVDRGTAGPGTGGLSRTGRVEPSGGDRRGKRHLCGTRSGRCHAPGWPGPRPP